MGCDNGGGIGRFDALEAGFIVFLLVVSLRIRLLFLASLVLSCSSPLSSSPSDDSSDDSSLESTGGTYPQILGGLEFALPILCTDSGLDMLLYDDVGRGKFGLAFGRFWPKIELGREED